MKRFNTRCISCNSSVRVASVPEFQIVLDCSSCNPLKRRRPRPKPRKSIFGTRTKYLVSSYFAAVTLSSLLVILN